MMSCHALSLALILSLLGAGGVAAASSENSNNNEQLFQQQQLLIREKPPLRVFVLVGQSNMVGHGSRSALDESTGQQKNATLEWLVANAPDRFGMLKQELGESGEVGVEVRAGKSGKTKKKSSQKSEWAIRPDVFIACNSRALDDLSPRVTTYGNLYAGLCAGDPDQKDQVGPELGFGWAVGDAFNRGVADNDNKVLLLKIAWGGKSLAVDFRPPSSGGTTGPFYESVIANVKNTMTNIAHIFPNESDRPVQLSGFAWHQGWNDGCNDTMAAEYEYNLANLIRDVRKDLNMPDLPFAIAGTGMKGYSKQPTRREDVINAELKVAKYPEFKGGVASVDTRPFARGPAPASPTDFGYHWMCNAESYWLIGQSLGKSMVDLVNHREEGQVTEES
eukprot:CAMPEP_0201923168 /NCGR_PEP_ID=MMETSP0903-20130614/10991_1 /ASSEMBLY_ACC=CAM_ASM_000552 /TAXON_ID=420261 /ORGANISM="Thalassiosira antarctica, Strain CCMP982" /LENGTH=390 /DNA_ID=CAMNT_0048460443 /DNA_START=122 /DNA_END=1294 /DNA_ORIENTATION=+